MAVRKAAGPERYSLGSQGVQRTKQPLDAMARAIYGKPAEHCFEQPDRLRKAHGMSAIEGEYMNFNETGSGKGHLHQPGPGNGKAYDLGGSFHSEFRLRAMPTRERGIGRWSLLSYNKVEEFNKRGANVGDGAFGENLVVDG